MRRQREEHGIARRENAILLLDDGKSCQEISDFLYMDDDTIRCWHKTFLQEGWYALAFDGWKGGRSPQSDIVIHVMIHGITRLTPWPSQITLAAFESALRRVGLFVSATVS